MNNDQQSPPTPIWGRAGGGEMHPQVHPRAASSSARAAAARIPAAGAALHCPPPHVDLCASPPPGCVPCVAPLETAPACCGEGWGFTPPLHCPV